jgi:hypothetical protein
VNGHMNGGDRYKALGIPYPDPGTMCQGQCEGIGVFPQYNREAHVDRDKPGVVSMEADPDMLIPAIAAAWEAAHAAAGDHEGKPCDGWHFIQCPDCKGTGKRG